MTGMGIHDAARMRELHRKNVRVALIALASALSVVALAAWLLFVSAGR